MLARRHRITRGEDYRRVVRRGRRFGGATCVTHFAHTRDHAAPARFGFIVARSVGNAVTRNRVRRRLKAIAHGTITAGFSGADVVFRALPTSATAGFSELERDVTRALARARRAQQAEAADAARSGAQLEATAGGAYESH